ncbi:MAG TPA: hypothetical protein VH475_26450 [Tepidisphaeraceae bacterium]|jgi:arginase family enzyme
MERSVNLNLDDAWDGEIPDTPGVDAREWGPRIRYFAPERLLAEFADRVLAPLPPFVIYGSGDFHHLSGWLVRRVTEPVTLISFDNHPDWDVRPPKWTCGGWINRALECEQVRRAVVWGCGNFELNWPSRIFGNRRVAVHAWAERFGPGVRRRFDCMTREDWRGRFGRFAESLAGSAVYVTVDLDCLRAEEAVTNWENGLFTAEDVAWAIGMLREHCRVVAGDVCGAHSPPRLERWTQRLASWWDHPKLSSADDVGKVNARALSVIWPAMVG